MKHLEQQELVFHQVIQEVAETVLAWYCLLSTENIKTAKLRPCLRRFARHNVMVRKRSTSNRAELATIRDGRWPPHGDGGLLC